MRRLLSLAPLCIATMAAAQSPVAVDLELVLAVDTSRSMDYDELRLQREGYAAALEHPAVTSAFNMGPLGRTAIIFFEWGGPGTFRILQDWTLIETAQDAAAMAQALRNHPIQNLRGTSISGALEQAADLLDTNDYEGTRRVIDISGDGPNNMGRPVDEVRDELAARGIEINGLPFMVKEPGGSYTMRDLDIYYEDCVITGGNAFVIPIHQMSRLVASIRQKLVLEISGLPGPPNTRPRPASTTDCLIGERMRQQRWFDDP